MFLITFVDALSTIKSCIWEICFKFYTEHPQATGPAMKVILLFKTSVLFQFSFTFTAYLLSCNLTVLVSQELFFNSSCFIGLYHTLPVKTISTLRNCFLEICFKFLYCSFHEAIAFSGKLKTNVVFLIHAPC